MYCKQVFPAYYCDRVQICLTKIWLPLPVQCSYHLFPCHCNRILQPHFKVSCINSQFDVSYCPEWACPATTTVTLLLLHDIISLPHSYSCLVSDSVALVGHEKFKLTLQNGCTLCVCGVYSHNSVAPPLTLRPSSNFRAEANCCVVQHNTNIERNSHCWVGEDSEIQFGKAAKNGQRLPGTLALIFFVCIYWGVYLSVSPCMHARSTTSSK